MFDETQYVIEGRVAATFLKIAKDNYNIKDINGNLLAFFKGRNSGFLFEEIDGTSLGKILTSRNRFEVYDAQNRLQATIRREEHQVGEKNVSRGGIIHYLPIVMGLGMIIAPYL